ncbi:MAG TPA: flavodoxin domain-containing protein [Chitinophagaceae bacterium]|nr:flavodoxin domain-containing protein [Chitinophagaceae bacterium]
MLGEPKLKILLDLVNHSSQEELVWMNGYLTGLLSASEKTLPESPQAKPLVNKITIAYGTETGNSKRLATDFAAKAKKKGINAKLVSLDQYRLNDLSKEEYFLTIISTQGDGEPPLAAKKFYDHIHLNGFKLSKLKYGVLALGDTSYPLFCKAGEDVDTQLKNLGGERIAALQKCDTDYETEAHGWFEQVIETISRGSQLHNSPAPIVVNKKPAGKKIFTGTVLTNINLNDRGSNKQTHHLEIAADEIDYLPGDSIGIVPQNADEIVQSILSLAQTNNSDLHEVLKKKLNVVYLADRVVKKYGAIVQQEIPETKIGLLDLLKIYPLKDPSQFEQVVSILEPITPRLYSISSSLEAHAGEVHITVARDKFQVNGQLKYGHCSDLLSNLSVDSPVDFYVHKNSQFRLPADEKDIIMIGPGTGIAPFRSFLAHRDSTGATGRNWLFFGDQHFVTDFLYQSEIQNWIDTGVLTKVNVAFSRDQNEKVYVQHKMKKYGKELFEWLELGASIYLCGAKDPMSVDVENGLLEIINEHGKINAEEYLQQLKEEGRYHKDVY